MGSVVMKLAKLNYKFANEKLLYQALTTPSSHRSVKEHYQRLEFLGDAVLGLVIAQKLIELYPEDNEGSLAKKRSSLVNQQLLAKIAVELELGEALKLNTVAKYHPDRHNPAILADVLEAVIGAIYLDSNMEEAAKFIEENWRDYLLGLTATPQDPRSALQEWAQSKHLGLPLYQTLSISGPDHAPLFTVEVTIPGSEEFSAQAQANNKKQAYQQAASYLWEKIHEKS